MTFEEMLADRGRGASLWRAIQAEAHYRQALALADELGMRPLQAHCHRTLGILYATTGQPRARPVPNYPIAIELYKAMEMTYWLPQAEAALARAEGGENTRAG